MRRKTPANTSTDDLFRSRLETILDDRHELVRLAKSHVTFSFDVAFSGRYWG